MNTQNRSPLLEVKSLCVVFTDSVTGRKIRAVDDVSFCVPHNSFVGLTGESGSGKTTVALSILGLTKGSPGIIGGAVFYNGEPLYDAQAWARLSPLARARRIEAAIAPLRGKELFMIFQEPRAALNPYWRIEAQLMECLHRHAQDHASENLRQHLHHLLDSVWLPHSVLRMFPAELSTGMCQRILIAMALALGVKLLVADEPLSRIDLRLQRKVVLLLEALRTRRTMAMLLSTHDLDLIRRLTDTVVVMFRGKVIEIGPTATVLDPHTFPKHEYTRRLVATHELVEGAKAQLGPNGVHKAFNAALLATLKKQILLGPRMVEVAQGHWIRESP